MSKPKVREETHRENRTPRRINICLLQATASLGLKGNLQNILGFKLAYRSHPYKPRQLLS